MSDDLSDVRYQVALSYGRGAEEPGHTRGMGLRIVAYGNVNPFVVTAACSFWTLSFTFST